MGEITASNLFDIRFSLGIGLEFGGVKQALILTDMSDSALAQAQEAIGMLNLAEVQLTLGFISEPRSAFGGVLMRVGDILKEQAEKELKAFGAQLPQAELMIDRWKVFQQQIRSGAFDLVIQTKGQRHGLTTSLPNHLLSEWGIPILSFPAHPWPQASDSA